MLEAGTGVEALEVMAREKGKVDIVVSDVIMPEMDGPTLLKELRKTRPGLKFIFVSGYPDDAFKKSLDEDEAYSFLPKPFTLSQLAAKVKEQLGGSDSTRHPGSRRAFAEAVRDLAAYFYGRSRIAPAARPG